MNVVRSAPPPAAPPWESCPAEAARLRSLIDCGVLDTGPEPEFDEVAELAATVCDTRFGGVAFADEGCFHFKALHGLEAEPVPRDAAICEAALAEPGLLVVPDLAADPRFTPLPLVAGGPCFRFYAGHRLIDPEGRPLGTLCVMDAAPRPQGLAPAQAFALRALARQLAGQLELRRALTWQARATARLATEVADRTRALADGEARFRAYFERAPDALFDVALTTGGGFRLAAINPAGWRLLGLGPPATGTVPELPPMPEARAWLRPKLEACVREGSLRFEVTGRTVAVGRRLDGIMVTMPDAAGRPSRILVYIRDITAQRETEAGLHQARKMAALGQLCAGVAHDFANLLQGALIAAEAIRDRPDDPATVARLSGTVVAGMERGGALTRRMLAFARGEAARTEAVDLPVLLRGLHDLLERTLGPGVRLRLDLAPTLPRVRLDPAQLELALMNLVLNARDAMEGRGTVTVSAEGTDAPTGAAQVLLRVADTGPGMAPEVLARAGQPFFTTKPHGRGTGLGLSMARGFAEQAGGTLRIASAPGQGTAVCLSLPALAAPLGSPAG